MKLINDIADFLEEKEGYEYLNPNNVTVEVEDDETFTASYCLLGESVLDSENSLIVDLYCNRAAFIELLNIKSVTDLDKITAGQLIELYQEGKAVMSCFVTLTYTYCMSFKKAGTIIKCINDRNQEHEVPDKLRTPEEYIGHAREYYSLIAGYSES